MKKNVKKQILHSTIATALLAGGAVSGVTPAQALLSDNVHNSGAGGMTNCNGGDVCVEKVGDEVKVSYEIQFGNIMRSSDHGQTASGSLIAFPSVIQNPKLEVVSTSIEKDGEYGKYSNPLNGFPTHTFEKPVEVPLLQEDELEDAGLDAGDSNVGFKLKDNESDPENDASYVSKFDDKRKFATHVKGDEIVSQFKEGYAKLKQEDPERDVSGNGNIVSNDALQDVDDYAEIPDTVSSNNLLDYGAMEVDYPYDYLLFNNDSEGVTTYRLTGTVKTESDLAYLPIRAKQGLWKCSQEGYLGGYEDGCQSLAEYSWGRNRDVLPRYSLENDDVTRRNLKNDTKDGLHGSLQCAVTEDLGRNDLIGSDVRPRNLDGSPSWGAKYDQTFQLHANRAVTHLAGAYDVAEDGCDQAGVKISICKEEEKPTSPVTPPSSEQDTTPPRDDRSESSTEPAPSSDVTSSEPPAPEQNSTSESPAPEQKSTSNEPESSTALEDTSNTTKPAARIIPSSPAPVTTPPAVNHTSPEKQPIPENPSRVNNAPFVPAPVQPAAIPGPVSENGPVVNTGGSVHESFWTKIANLFR